MNNLEALERLKKSAKEQSEELKRSVTEVHQESSKQIASDLRNLHSERLKAMQERIDEELGKPQPTPWALLSIIAATTLIVGLIAGAWLMKELLPNTNAEAEQKIKELEAWSIPEEMRREDKDGQYLMVPRNHIYTKKDSDYAFVLFKWR